MTYKRLIWTQGAIDDYRAGRVTKRLQRHTISNLDWQALRTFEQQIVGPRIVVDQHELNEPYATAWPSDENHRQ